VNKNITKTLKSEVNAAAFPVSGVVVLLLSWRRKSSRLSSDAIYMFPFVCSDQKPAEFCPLSQEVRSETSSNPSSPEICTNKERYD